MEATGTRKRKDNSSQHVEHGVRIEQEPRAPKRRLSESVVQDVGSSDTKDSVWLDGPLALTLLPPIASFLTGGDFVRDSLVLALLFYYLRALIKTPWELYLDARARRPPPDLLDDDETEETIESESRRQLRAAARSELRFAELVYLGLCLVTPFLGTLLLQYGASLLSSDGTFTWFSKGLFVLATGIRPWRHLVALLTQRTTDLHDIVHMPSPSSTSRSASARLEDLEKSIADLKNTVKNVTESTTNGLKDLRNFRAVFDETTEYLETQVRNALRAGEERRLDTDNRLEEMSRIIHAASKKRPSQPIAFVDNEITSGGGKNARAGHLTPLRRLPGRPPTNYSTPHALARYFLDRFHAKRRSLLSKLNIDSASDEEFSIMGAMVWIVLLPVRISQALLKIALGVLGLSATGESSGPVEGDVGKIRIAVGPGAGEE